VGPYWTVVPFDDDYDYDDNNNNNNNNNWTYKLKRDIKFCLGTPACDWVTVTSVAEHYWYICLLGLLASVSGGRYHTL
jgi:hypothetical protein